MENWVIKIGFVFVAIGLFFLSKQNYLLFHSFIELISVFLALGSYILAIKHLKPKGENPNNIYIFMGVMLGCVGFIDLLHTSVFKGMNIIPLTSSNEATQFWIIARFVQAVSLAFLSAYTLSISSIKIKIFHVATVSIAILSILSVIVYPIFPDCFIDGKGLTPFKIGTEYVIIAVLIVSLAQFRVKNKLLKIPDFKTLQNSIIFMILSEFCFTLYTDPYGVSNAVGHIFKFLSIMLLAQSLLKNLFISPFEEINNQLINTNKKLESRANQAENFYQRIIEITPAIVSIVDFQSQKIIFESPSCSKVLFTNSDPLLKPHNEIYTDRIHRNDRPLVQANDDKLMKSAVGEIVETRFRIRNSNGYWIWVHSHETVFERDANEIPTSKIAIALDITELQQAKELLETKQIWLEKTAARLDSALTEANKANIAKSQLLTNVSHEFRTPLNAIIGYATLLQETLGKNSKHARWTQIIDKSATHLLFLIDQLLDFSKMEQNRLNLKSEVFEPASLIEECLSIIKPEIQTNVVFEEQISQFLPKILRGDANRVRQVLLNLLSNAAHFTTQGTIGIEVNATSEEPNTATLAVTVWDTGCGMSEAFLPTLFEPFTQENNNVLRPHPGTGLGMALSKEIVTAMGGNILVSSQLGKGSRFVVTMNFERE